MSETFTNTRHNHFETIIIGGGPAGLAAAIWCADLKMRAALFDDGPQFGGQLGWTFNEITNFPGYRSIRPEELRRRFIAQLSAAGSTVARFAKPVATVDLAAKTVELKDGGRCTADAIIIATGVRRRKLGVPGEDKFSGRGILKSGVNSIDEAAGRHVVVIGGGDAALENAVIISDYASRVTVVHRGSAFSARQDFLERAARKDNIEFMFSTRVTEISGETQIEDLELVNTLSSTLSRLAADLLLIRIGIKPNTELFAGQLELDAAGFVVVSADTSTSASDVYAVGDAAFPFAPTLSTAVGSAASAVKVIEGRRRRGGRNC